MVANIEYTGPIDSKTRKENLDTTRALPGKDCWSFILAKLLHTLALEVIIICLDIYVGTIIDLGMQFHDVLLLSLSLRHRVDDWLHGYHTQKG